jgi:septal ring factor EnvC (AmiA/AmiB activator)
LPESIRNAIVLAVIAVLVAVVGVGLLAWSRRPATPPARQPAGLPLLVNDREGGLYDVTVKVQQMERRLAESQLDNQKLMEQLKVANEERGRLTSRLAGLEKEVRSMRKRLQDAEQRLPPRPQRAPSLNPATSAPATSPPASTSAPAGEAPAGSTP